MKNSEVIKIDTEDVLCKGISGNGLLGNGIGGNGISGNGIEVDFNEALNDLIKENL